MFDSIRTRLTLLHIAILATVLVGFAAAAYLLTLRELDRDLDGRLEEMSRSFTAALEAESADDEHDDTPSHIISQTVQELNFRDYQFIVYSVDGQLIAASMTGPLPFVDPGMNGVSEIGAEGHRLRALAAEIEFQGGRYKLFVLHSLAERTAMRDQLLKIFLGAVPLALFIAGLAGYWLTRRWLRPMVEMTRRAEKITAENLSERLSIKNKRDEVGKLTRVINELLGRLESAFEQQRRFMADASHELRTPLAIVRGESEVALLSDSRPAAEYRESLAVVNDESNRLTKIVEDLFTLARADAGQVRVEFAMVYLDEIVAETARSVRVLANEKQIAMNIECRAEMPAKGDEALLRRLFLNLLDNAIKYSPASGRVTIRCDTSADAYRIEVRNAGRPIPPGEKKNIFERFYRVDKARSRSAPSETSGAGLGLPIAQWIAEMHGGKVELVASGDCGTTFAVVIPHNG